MATLATPGPARSAFFGATCVDVILETPFYPAEDSEARISALGRSTGGNATNSACVCAQLCTSLPKLILSGRLSAPIPITDLVSVVPDPARDNETRWAIASLAETGVGTNHLIVLPRADGLPISYIVLTPGSRTIFHSRGIPEMDSDAAEAAMLSLRALGGDAPLQWLHFEGRALDATAAAMRLAIAAPPLSCRIVSVELEKRRPDGDVESLLPLADVVFVGHEYSTTVLGVADAPAALRALAPRCRPGALLIATWGGEGAYAWADWLPSSEPLHAPSVTPSTGLVDTIGAGDSFVAAVVAAGLLRPSAAWLRHAVERRYHETRAEPPATAQSHLLEGSLRAWLGWACLVAGLKCGQKGLRLEKAALAAIAEALPEEQDSCE